MKLAQKKLSPLTRLLLIFLLLVFWGVSLRHLTVLPLVYEDEAWQASTGWKLATQGTFGSDLFAGYHEMEQHYFGFLPLYPFALALLFRFADVGLFQARFVGIACGLLTFALTYSLAQRLYRDTRVGLMTIFVLLCARGFVVSALHPTGILFLDAMRVARYDVLPPVFGLLTLHTYLTAKRTNLERWYFCAGLCAALGGLAYALLGTFALVEWLERANKGALGIALMSFALLPWMKREGWVLVSAIALSLVVLAPRNPRAWRALGLGVVSVLLIAAPWHIFISAHNVSNTDFAIHTPNARAKFRARAGDCVLFCARVVERAVGFCVSARAGAVARALACARGRANFFRTRDFLVGAFILSPYHGKRVYFSGVHVLSRALGKFGLSAGSTSCSVSHCLACHCRINHRAA